MGRVGSVPSPSTSTREKQQRETTITLAKVFFAAGSLEAFQDVPNAFVVAFVGSVLFEGTPTEMATKLNSFPCPSVSIFP